MSTGAMVLTILLLAIVGAFIGGITNHLAIKMLFRPYKALYIGKFRVPFTPGVIPKRHEEISVQLGNLVMQHLITAEGIEKRFLDERFKSVIQSKVISWVDRYLEEKRPNKEDLLAHFPIDQLSKNVEEELINRISSFVTKKIDQYKFEDLETILPLDLSLKIEEGLPDLSRHIATSVRDYIQTDEAKGAIKGQLDKFFEGRGMLGSMLNMFLGNQSLIDFIYPDLIKFLERPQVQLAIHQFLEKEWKKIKAMTLEDISQKFSLEDQAQTIIRRLIQLSPLRQVIENPGESLAEWREPITKTLIPIGLTVLLKKASKEAANLLQSLELDTLVSDQVREFSMKELENVILMISKKEFKMITYLGAFLGGLIGLIQAFLMLFIGKL